MLLQYHEAVKFKTKPVDFQAAYLAKDAGTLELLKDLTARRKALEESINGSSRLSEAIAREVHGGITSKTQQDLQKVERYLPLLEDLVSHVAPQQQIEGVATWQRELKIRWTSPLSWGGSNGGAFGGPRFFGCDDLRFEHAMVLALYAGMLRECAMEALDSDPTEAAKLLRRAAGVHQHCAENVLPGLAGALPSDKPAEVSLGMAQAWHWICLAEAQAVTVRVAERKGSGASLLAKLHWGCVELYDSAVQLLVKHGADWRELSEKFLRYLKVSGGLHELRSRWWLAEEATKGERVGTAISLLRAATSQIERVKMPGDVEWRVVYTLEVNALYERLKKLTNENDNIYREKEPPLDTLSKCEGRQFWEPLLYEPSPLRHEFVFVTR